MEKVCGIYLITNLVSGHQYVGKDSYINKQKRWRNHKTKFRKRYHENKYFQNAWYKYGEENFSYEIIEYCSKEELNEREIFWIKELNTKVPNGYNMTDGGDGGLNPSEETRKKLSIASLGNKYALGHKPTAEENQRRSDANKGRIVSQETRDKISKIHKGKIVREETRKKLSDINMGKKVPIKVRKKMSKSHKGKKFTEEHKNNLSKAQIGKRKNNGKNKYIGVSYHKQSNKWRARGVLDHKRIELGLFFDETDAGQAYDVFMIENYGLNAKINFPNKLEDYKEILELK